MLNLSDNYLSAIQAGFCYECPCGEILRTVSHAVSCKKCRNYSSFPGKFVIDIRTNEVVYGQLPSKAEADHSAGLGDIAAAISLNKFHPLPISDEP